MYGPHHRFESLDFAPMPSPRIRAQVFAYLFSGGVLVSVDEDTRSRRSRPRPERSGSRSFGMRLAPELPRPSGAAGRVV